MDKTFYVQFLMLFIIFTERPAPPMGPLRVSEVTSSSLRLTWEASPYDGGMEITSYYIEKLEKTQKHWQKVAEVGASVRTYVVTELVEGHEYMFRVFAVNAFGISDSLEVSETILIKSPFGKFSFSSFLYSLYSLFYF